MMRRLFVCALLSWPVAAAAQVVVPEIVSEPLLLEGADVVVESPDPSALGNDGLVPAVPGIVLDEPPVGASPGEAMPQRRRVATTSRVTEPRDYVVLDFLFLDRDNATNNQPIVVQGPTAPSPGATVLTTRAMTPTTAPGVRLFVGRHACDRTGWELGYWGAYGFFGDSRADLPSGLAVPGDLGAAVPGWNSAETVRAAWQSSLNVAELNLLRSEFTTLCDPCSPRPSLRCRQEREFDWIGGLFWAGLDEQAALQVTAAPGDTATAYRVATASNLVGGQLGGRGRWTWDRFSFEGSLKAGLGGAWLEQSASPITSSLVPGFEYRRGQRSLDTGMGFLSSLNATASYRFTDTWGLRVGYNLAWLSGVALAPNQWDFTDTTASGTAVRGAGGVFLHGANLGLEARW
jgi:hypothetical protein